MTYQQRGTSKSCRKKELEDRIYFVAKERGRERKRESKICAYGRFMKSLLKCVLKKLRIDFKKICANINLSFNSTFPQTFCSVLVLMCPPHSPALATFFCTLTPLAWPQPRSLFPDQRLPRQLVPPCAPNPVYRSSWLSLHYRTCVCVCIFCFPPGTGAPEKQGHGV